MNKLINFRRKALSAILLLTMLSSSFSLFAQTFSYEYEGVSLKYTVIGEKAVKIVKSYDYEAVNITGEVKIPKEVIYDDITYSVTTIGSFSFGSNVSPVSVLMPNSITTIESMSFDYCTSLKSITIPKSVLSIGEAPFMGCNNLVSIDVDDDNANYCSLDGVLFDKDKTTLIQYPIGNRQIHYSIPSTVKTIGRLAFFNCGSITSIILPNSLTTIENRAFSQCYNISSIIIPNYVSTIGECAFWGCSSLASVTIPKSVTSIGDGIFSNCINLETISVDNDNSKYCSDNCVLFNKNKSEIIQYPAGNKDTSYSIPNTVTSICGYAFSCCSFLTSVTIPESVTSIGEDAFCRCSSLTSIILPESVTSIGMHAFYECSSLTSVTIPKSVTSIGMYAFYGCSSLNLLKIMGDDIFVSNINNTNTVLAVPASRLSEYKEAYPNNKVISVGEVGFEPENNELSVIPSKTNTLSLSLEAFEVVNGFQMDVALPEGLSISEKDGKLAVSFGEGTATASHTLSASKVSGDNKYRIVAYSSENEHFLSGENLLNIEIVSDENFKCGDINVCDVFISTTDGEGYQGIDFSINAEVDYALIIGEDITIEEDETLQLEPVTNPSIEGLILEWSSTNPDVAYVDADNMLHALVPGEAVITAANAGHGISASVTVTVSPVLYGDSNDNGAVSIDDIVTDVHYILEKDPQPFSFKKADVNRDRAINILDVSKTVAIVLSDEAQQSSMMSAHLCEARPVQSSLSADNVSLDATGRAVMRLHLGDDSDITALQGDIRLPEGLHVRNITLSGEQTGDHLVSFAELKSGAVRFAVYSMSLAGVTANTPVLDIELEGDTPYIAGEATVNGIYASDTDCNLRRMADINAAISIPTVVMETEADADAPADVYTPQGVLILRNATSEDIRHLAPGLYIIAGKKILVK